MVWRRTLAISHCVNRWGPSWVNATRGQGASMGIIMVFCLLYGSNWLIIWTFVNTENYAAGINSTSCWHLLINWFEGSLLFTCSISIPEWISNYINHTVWEWVHNFIPPFTGHVITYPCWLGLQFTVLVKVAPGDTYTYKSVNWVINCSGHSSSLVARTTAELVSVGSFIEF